MTTASKITVGFCLWSLAGVMLLASCNGSGTQQRISEPVLSDFEFLELGMEYDQVVTRVGEADRDMG